MSWIITGTQKNNWTPADITTALWLDAADVSTIATSGSEVTQINDKSGYGRNFTGASGTRPSTGLATLNGKNVLGFTGDYLTSASPASTWTFLHDATSSSCFCVVKFGVVASPNTAYVIYGTNNGSTSNIGKAIYYDDRASISRNDTLIDLTTQGVNSIPVITNVAGNGFISANTHNLLTLHSSPNNAVAADRSELSVNAGTPAKNNTDTNPVSTASPTYTLQIGGAGNNALPLVGELAEFIFTSGAASLDTQQKMEGYLAHKWGLTAILPAGHPYKTAVPVP